MDKIISKLEYFDRKFPLHKRAIPMWVKRDRLKENKNKIAYLTEASNLFLAKCEKEGITSFEDYDAKYKIHYRSKDWFKAFQELVVENKREYGSILKRVRDAISTFS